MRRFLVLIVCSLFSATAAAQLGTFTARLVATEIAGHPSLVDVYEPATGPNGNVAIIAHGFTRSRTRHRDLAEALAVAGVTAVVPDLPNVLDHWGNGDAIVELEHAVEAGALGLPPVSRSRIVLIGTSAGGLATVLAAAKLPGLAGWIGLDPVDRTGAGKRAAAQLTSPAVVLLAEPSTCNLYSSGRSIARAVPGLLRTTKLEGASHCDFESPTNKLCRVLCGGSSSEMQGVARSVTVDATLELLRGSRAPSGTARPSEPQAFPSQD